MFNSSMPELYSFWLRTSPIVANPFPPSYGCNAGAAAESSVANIQVCWGYSPVSRVDRDGVHATAATK